MRRMAAVAIAVAALGGARLARSVAADLREESMTSEPFAPSPDSARVLSLGYPEMTADLLFVRLTGYFGSGDATARGLRSLVQAINRLDPKFHRVYEYGARAITMAKHGVDQQAYLDAVGVLEAGMKEFPNEYMFPYLAGQIYLQDLQTKDPAQRREWDEKGTLLVEIAVRKPGAPAELAEFAAVMRTKLGQHERAVRELEEMLLVTTDDKARNALLERLAKLQNADVFEIASEIEFARRKGEAEWKRERPFMPQSLYLIVGPRNKPAFDMATLATGGRDFVGSETYEKLEPLE